MCCPPVLAGCGLCDVGRVPNVYVCFACVCTLWCCRVLRVVSGACHSPFCVASCLLLHLSLLSLFYLPFFFLVKKKRLISHRPAVALLAANLPRRSVAFLTHFVVSLGMMYISWHLSFGPRLSALRTVPLLHCRLFCHRLLAEYIKL